MMKLSGSMRVLPKENVQRREVRSWIGGERRQFAPFPTGQQASFRVQCVGQESWPGLSFKNSELKYELPCTLLPQQVGPSSVHGDMMGMREQRGCFQLFGMQLEAHLSCHYGMGKLQVMILITTTTVKKKKYVSATNATRILKSLVDSQLKRT